MKRSLAPMWMLCAALAACGGDAPTLTPVPDPPMEGLGEQDRQRLTRERQDLDLALNQDVPDVALAGAYARLGQAYMAHEFARAASVAFDNALRLNPRDSASQYRLGILQLRQGEFESALDYLTRASDLRPGDCAAHVRAAEAATGLARDTLARQLLEQALSIQACEAVAHERLARLALAGNEARAARDHALAALALDPQADSLHAVLNSAYRLLGEHEQAARHAEQAGDGAVSIADPLIESLSAYTGGGMALLREADALAEQGDVTRAIDLLREAISRDPNLWRAHLQLGRLLAERREFAAAEASLSKAIELEPAEVTTRLDLAAVISRQGDFARAISVLDHLLTRRPEHVDTLKRRAELLGLTGDEDAARADLERILSLDPGQSDSRQRLANLLWRQGESARAVEILDAGLAANPDSAARRSLLLQRMFLLARNGQFEVALDDAREVHRLGQGETQAYEGVLSLLADPSPTPRSLPLAQAERWSRVAIAMNATGLARDLLDAAQVPRGADARLQTAMDRVSLAAQPSPDAARALARDLAARFNAAPDPELAELTAMALSHAGEFDEALAWQARLIDLAMRNNASNSVLTRLWRNQQVLLAGGKAQPEEYLGQDR